MYFINCLEKLQCYQLITDGEKCRSKDTCRKSYVKRPLSDRKICEQHLIAHFQWRFLRFQIEFLHCYEQMIAMEAVYWGGRWLRHGDGYLFDSQAAIVYTMKGFHWKFQVAVLPFTLSLYKGFYISKFQIRRPISHKHYMHYEPSMLNLWLGWSGIAALMRSTR